MSIFSVGLSGLNTAQKVLNTTSDNIANVYTPGYNRQQSMLAEQQNGQGVKVSETRRFFDQFISGQLNAASSDLSALKSYQRQAAQVDNFLADQQAGLAPLMQNFFASVQDLVASPSDAAARQGVLGTADVLAGQFRAFDDYLNDLNRGVNDQVRTAVSEINNAAEKLASLNREINLATARSGQAPNNLLNLRDQVVSELSEKVDVRVSVQDGQAYNVSIGDGIPLVAGGTSGKLTATPSGADPNRLAVGFTDAAGNTVEQAESGFRGGVLAGLMSFREETLIPVQNEVGRLAATFALAFNEQHAAGLDAEGNPGADMFSLSSPQVHSHRQNTGGTGVSAEFGDYRELTGTDYSIRVADASADQVEITRARDGETVTRTLDANGQLELDGVVLTFSGALADGDRFLLHPTRRAAADMHNQISDIGAIAAGLSGESGDNRNALALQELQNAELVGGNASFTQHYAAIVSDAGNKANIVNVNTEAQQTLTDQIREIQQSESGVNLDEEAANLIRFQQYYQANARVIDVGSTIIDTLLGLRA